MASSDSLVGSRTRKRKRESPPGAGPYILRPLLSNVPLSAEGKSTDIEVTCVELWNENLYIGTSAAEILHFVSITPDPSDTSGQPTYILASRQQPTFIPSLTTSQASAGVQQILVLPTVSKACVLCNGTLTFFSLPELSPAFGNNARFKDCLWVGGVDQSQDGPDTDKDGVTIMICLRSRIRLFKIGDSPSKVRDIEFAGVVAAVRRDNIACAADARSYILLDVVHKVKNPLFPISSLDEQWSAGMENGIQEVSSNGRPEFGRRVSSLSGPPAPRFADDRIHGRSTSLGTFASRLGTQQQDGSTAAASQQATIEPSDGRDRQPSPRPLASPERRNSRPTSPAERDRRLEPVSSPVLGPSSQGMAQGQLPRSFVPLKPLIETPTEGVYLLVIGTLSNEPGVGMFVNTDGDVVRGSLEFRQYPEALLVDGKGVDFSTTQEAGAALEEGYVLAVMSADAAQGVGRGIEIQRWDLESSPGGVSKEWLEINPSGTGAGPDSPESGQDRSLMVGIRNTVTTCELTIPEILDKLRLRRTELILPPHKQGNSPDLQLTEQEARGDLPSRTERQATREREESSLVSRLCTAKAHIAVWSGDQIWWAVRNPLVMKLDAQLQPAERLLGGAATNAQSERSMVERVINSIRGQQPRVELEFLSLRYIRQKASLILFIDLVNKTREGILAFEQDKRATEDALIQGELDPRVLLACLPILRNEVIEGSNGIWMQNGLKELIEGYVEQQEFPALPDQPDGPFGDNILHLMKRYLLLWRRKKGFGSIADEKEIFHTVDAALLHVLLLLDRHCPQGPATAGSVRAELNSVVDHGVDCFERAVKLLEQYKRLYILSRLYQSRRLPDKVLATWRRILEGEPDKGGEFIDGEQEVRRYLSKIRDAAVVEEYGAWLANRNPKLGVQIFADDKSRVRFEPAQAVDILKQKAPGAVKEYLEYLVFGKNHTQYVNDLLSFYLDTVLTELDTSEASRSTLLQSYETYRALHPPKPTYRQFITDNAIDAEWWHNRLRLLQLLGGSNGAASQYDVRRILERIEPFAAELVPEMIILDGRQNRHQEAVRLLVHGLGDFDTAISYCLSGGSNIFRSGLGLVSREEGQPSRDEQARLFGYLLAEFLRIEDVSARIERTGELLERFGGWFDVRYVLDLIPESWSVDIVSNFLVSALRQLLTERNESSVVRALSGAENLRISAEFVEKMEGVGPRVERAEVGDVDNSRGFS